MLTHDACFWNFLWPCQVDEIQSALLCRVFFVILLCYMDDEQWMTTRWPLIHSSKCNFSILRTIIHYFKHLLRSPNRNLSTILNKNAFMFIFLNLKSCFWSYINKKSYDLTSQKVFSYKFPHMNIWWRIQCFNRFNESIRKFRLLFLEWYLWIINRNDLDPTLSMFYLLQSGHRQI